MKGRNVMKKRKLKKWVKVVLTAGILAFSAFLYSNINDLGIMAQHNNFYAIICMSCWTWIVFGQIALIEYLWEEM